MNLGLGPPRMEMISLFAYKAKAMVGGANAASEAALTRPDFWKWNLHLDSHGNIAATRNGIAKVLGSENFSCHTVPKAPCLQFLGNKKQNMWVGRCRYVLLFIIHVEIGMERREPQADAD